MKILYGVNGFGNGHVTRSRIMAKELSLFGHDVTYLFSGRDKDKYFDMEQFGENIIYKKGLEFKIKNGKVNYFKTLIDNDITTLLRDIDNLDLSEYDLVISDYEPITAWAAKLHGKTSIGIGHQYAFDKKIPLSHTNSLSLWLMNHYAPVNIKLGLHWDKFDQDILPPIIENLKTNVTVDNKIVVYLPFEDIDNLSYIFSLIDDYNFYVFTNNIPEKEYQNIIIKPLSKNGFLRELKSCYGVICNAGFELASETIHLNKKLLVKPVAGQMEQHSNAAALEELNYGKVVNQFTYLNIKSWLILEKIKKLPKYPNVAKEIVTWLQDYTKPFPFNNVWSKVK